jgi:hypothetical protein
MYYISGYLLQQSKWSADGWERIELNRMTDDLSFLDSRSVYLALHALTEQGIVEQRDLPLMPGNILFRVDAGRLEEALALYLAEQRRVKARGKAVAQAAQTRR